jgi:hypothetical protein
MDDRQFKLEAGTSTEVTRSEKTEPSSSAEFLSGESVGLVSIGTHQLFLHTEGPRRVPGDPVVIFLPGLGSSSSFSSSQAICTCLSL